MWINDKYLFELNWIKNRVVTIFTEIEFCDRISFNCGKNEKQKEQLETLREVNMTDDRMNMTENHRLG